jgi:hypothetical protein
MESTRAGSEKATSLGIIPIGGISKNSLSFLHPIVLNITAAIVIDNNIFCMEIIYP